MAPNKFEKKAKDVLERRAIAPSKDAWTQLNNKLEQSDKKRKLSVWWLGVAATLVGVMLAITLFNKEEVLPENTIVNQEKNQQNKEKPTITKNKIEENLENKPLVNVNEESENSKLKTEAPKTLITNKKKKPEQHLATVNHKNKEENNNQLINQISENIVAEVSEEQINLDEANQLLENAMNQFSADDYKNVTEKINANDLLEEVEMTSEKSLKHRLFHVVKSGYETVKSTVVSSDN
ncbi:hypothetical protein [Mesoflavibacter zeaxanthinifaciens]|uniref:hypothetical protein n=1 Tax=Mesoflavibacter zeaxanthinifaciens TaxID=393060 RepID=UPI00041D745B|nr:hypothetical protein [Mesoflavibacter zeaxanthinifaciens]